MSDLPMQTSNFSDLMLEDGTIITAEERKDEVEDDMERGRVKYGDVNWMLEDNKDYYNSWKRVKRRNYSMVKNTGEVFQLFSGCDKIIGKPQIRDNVKKTSITLVVKCEKKNKKGETEVKYKFVDDNYNRRDDGYEVSVLEKSYWVYDVVDNGETFLVFCDEQIENQEIHTFTGMKVKVQHKKDFEKNLSCRGSANLFFCEKAESTIKPIEKEKIVPFVEAFVEKYGLEKGDFVNLMFDYIFLHENNNIYRQPLDYMLLRHAHLLSGKEEGYPLQLCVWGGLGLGKTIEAECSDNIFQESILEAGNSTPKALIQSFKEKPANPGFILSRNRIAVIDELMKMIDNQISSSRGLSDVKNQLGQLNMILEHKKRTVGSGNDNTLTSQATAKTFILTNPSSRNRHLHQELNVLDASTLSRFLPVVKDEDHQEFIKNNKVLKCAETHSICYVGKGKGMSSMGIVSTDVLRTFYLIVYDSCQKITSNLCEKKVAEIHRTLTTIAKNPMKELFERRGLHHTRLILDGLVKYRCIFRDFDSSFTANEEDYDNLERILVRVIKSWDTDMGVKNNG